VAILLCTHNGAPFLETQLQSLSAQTYANWRLVVSDDGSTDGTRQILEHYSLQRPHSQVEIRHRAHALGAIANFMSLLSDADILGDFFACCDQDDVWWPDKLERALQWLHTVPEHVPAVYFSRTRNVDACGNIIGCSPLFRRAPSFRNALVQSIGGGNTMVFNRAARALLVAAGPVDVASHDWWTYLLVSGAGGSVYYDPNPSLDYRQHGANQIGANQGMRARFKRATMVATGQLAAWFGRHAAALVQCEHLLTDENRQLLGQFCAMRSGPTARRITAWNRLRPYRQSSMAQSLLFVALLANKL
jgi:glycosyltransferase involved in cell wall biosynthesis